MLFNLKEDPSQLNPIQDQRVEARLIEALVGQLKSTDALNEIYARMGLPQQALPITSFKTKYEH